MKLKKLFTAVMSLALMGNVMSYGPVNAQTDTPVDIEKSVYDWLVEYGSYDTDKNGDGVISLEEYETMEHMYIDLNYATDLSFLEKAKSLRKVDFSNGTITDFSVLKTMKNLRIIEFVNVPVSDISWSSELDLYMMYLVMYLLNVYNFFKNMSAFTWQLFEFSIMWIKFILISVY